MKLPIPDDWNESEDGYALLMMCIPYSQQWRATVRGRIVDITGGRVWDERTGRVTDVQAIGREIFESMAICKLDDLLIEFKRLNAIIAGEEFTVIQDGQTVHYDYLTNGLRPALKSVLLGTNSGIENLRVTVETGLNLAADTRSVLERAVLSQIVTAINGLELTANVTNNVEPSPVTVQVDPTPVTIQVDPTPVTVQVDPTPVTVDTSSIVSKLEELRTMLETRLTAETTAGNTRSNTESALLNAIENVLGGNYEP